MLLGALGPGRVSLTLGNASSQPENGIIPAFREGLRR